MIQRPVDCEDPDRLYTVTRGRSRVESNIFDLVALIVTERPPEPGFQSEHAAILGLCIAPTAVAEIAAELRLPVSVVKILLHDLLTNGHISVRHPSAAPIDWKLPDYEILKEVLVGLHKL